METIVEVFRTFIFYDEPPADIYTADTIVYDNINMACAILERR